MASPKTQAQQRRNIVARDRFGRIWSFSIETKTGDPTGLIGTAGWADPLRTPQKYMRVPKTEFGMPNYGTIDVNDELWAKDQAYYTDQWETQFLENAANKFPGGFDVNTVWDNPWIKKLTGPKPFPSVECLLAAFDPEHPASKALLGMEPLNEEAMALLGIDVALARRSGARSGGSGASAEPSATIPPKEVELPDFSDLPGNLKYQQFVAWARKIYKVDMKTVGAWWTAYKEQRAI